MACSLHNFDRPAGRKNGQSLLNHQLCPEIARQFTRFDMSSFDSLTLALEGWFDKPLSDLPDALQQRIEEDFWPMPWDRLSAAGRRDVTQQWDYQNDPATEQFRHFWSDHADRKISIMSQIADWGSIATPTALDLGEQEKRLAELRQELDSLEAEVFVGATEPNTADQPGLTSIVNVRKVPDVGSREWRSQNARDAANALHNQPGGSRDKQRQIRELWASGKYSSRDLCAEQECAVLNMSISAARHALNNTPNPSRC